MCYRSTRLCSLWVSLSLSRRVFHADLPWRGCQIHISLINLESRTLISVRPACSRWHSWRAPLITLPVYRAAGRRREPRSDRLLHVCCSWNMSSCRLTGPDGQSVQRPLPLCLLLSTHNALQKYSHLLGFNHNVFCWGVGGGFTCFSNDKRIKHIKLQECSKTMRINSKYHKNVKVLLKQRHIEIKQYHENKVVQE